MARQPQPLRLTNPWLVAVWPGMGQVATGAGVHVAQSLQPELAGELDANAFFTVDHVEVRRGIARPGRLPRSRFFVWRDPRGERDLVMFIGEGQPTTGGHAMCSMIMDFAIAQGVERVLTFAALGTRVGPTDDPRVFGAVTSRPLLRELAQHDVTPLPKGPVGGLNGALLAVAAERGIDAMCLLGEMPFFAGGVPNPKASLAVLERFTSLSDIWVDLGPLEESAADSEARLRQLQQQLEEQATRLLERNETIFEGSEDASPADSAEPEDTLDRATRRQIETLFAAAERDRQRAEELKATLDRLGAFREYEDRFLDLFK